MIHESRTRTTSHRGKRARSRPEYAARTGAPTANDAVPILRSCLGHSGRQVVRTLPWSFRAVVASGFAERNGPVVHPRRDQPVSSGLLALDTPAVGAARPDRARHGDQGPEHATVLVLCAECSGCFPSAGRVPRLPRSRQANRRQMRGVRRIVRDSDDREHLGPRPYTCCSATPTPPKSPPRQAQNARAGRVIRRSPCAMAAPRWTRRH